jgi:hypothetical protein
MPCSGSRSDRYRSVRLAVHRCVRRVAGLLALVLLVIGGSQTAHAASGPTLVIIADAATSKAAVKGLGAMLPQPWRLVDDGPLRRALANAGQRTSVGVALGSPAGRDSLAPPARAAATEVDATAVLFVRATPSSKSGQRTVVLLLISPNAIAPALDTTVEAPVSDDGAAVLAVLSPVLVSLAKAPSSAAPTAVPPAPTAAVGTPVPPSPLSSAPPGDGADAVTPAPASPRADGSIVELSAGAGTASRFFQYHDGLSPELRSYDLAAAPNLLVGAEVYPFARTKIPVLRGLGLAGGYERAVAISSKTSTGMDVSTVWWRAEGDLRIRYALGAEGRHLIGIRGGIVQERFGFTTSDMSLSSQLPDVDYLFWRVGAFGRASVGPIAFLLDASYLPAIAGGELANRFRESFFAAVEISGGLGVPLGRLFELRATAMYTRIFYSFNPSPGDENVAGGALDNIVRAQLTASFHL